MLTLVGIIDVYSRYLLGWSVSNTMEAGWVIECLKTAVARHGPPEIINPEMESNALRCAKPAFPYFLTTSNSNEHSLSSNSLIFEKRRFFALITFILGT